MKVKINQNRSEIVMKKDNESKITINIRQKEAFILFTETISIENPIVITKKDSEILFNNLCWFMDQHYKIENPDENAKYKDNNHFVWKSDIESFSKDPGTPRLIIDRDKDSISISKRIPLIEETKQRHAGGMVILDQKHEAEDQKTKTENSVESDLVLALDCAINKCYMYRPETHKKGIRRC